MDRLVLLAVCLLTGCHGYLRVPDGWPLPARSVPTCGGGEIEARDGEVFFSPHTRDVGASLGGSFTEVGEGVTVSSRRRATSRLEPGDRIVLVAAAIPPLPQKNEAGNQTL